MWGALQHSISCMTAFAASIRGDMQTTIKMAERQLGEGVEIRILKALFLLKWVP